MVASWKGYNGITYAYDTTGEGGGYLSDALKAAIDRAPFIAATDPLTTDDSTEDLTTHNVFTQGSLWLNRATGTMWICTNATNPAQWRIVWKRSSDAIVLGGESNVAFSTDSAVTGGKGNNAGGGSGAITAVSQANPTSVTSANHGLVTGETIAISGNTSTPSINGNQVVTVTGSNTFTVPVHVTNSGNNSGNWTTTATAAYACVSGGQNNKAVGKWSHAEGFGTQAVGASAHAEGINTTSRATAAHAEGSGTIASGNYAHAEGLINTAGGGMSHVEGFYNTAWGFCSHSEGGYSNASGFYSHAEGKWCGTSSTGSHAEGSYSLALGDYSHAEGHSTQAAGSSSHTEGKYTAANGDSSHAEGISAIAGKQASHAGGSRSRTFLDSQWARASGGFSATAGTAQTTMSQVFGTSSGATTTELTIGGVSPSGATGRIVVQSGQTLSCFINIVGRGGSAGYEGSFLRQVCISNNGGSTSLVGGVVQKVGTDINPDGWGTGSPADPISITADDTYDFLKIEVTGKSPRTIRWTATVFASEVANF